MFPTGFVVRPIVIRWGSSYFALLVHNSSSGSSCQWCQAFKPCLCARSPTNGGTNQMEKLREAHAKEKKQALAEFRTFKRSAKAREESIQVIPGPLLYRFLSSNSGLNKPRLPPSRHHFGPASSARQHSLSHPPSRPQEAPPPPRACYLVSHPPPLTPFTNPD